MKARYLIAITALSAAFAMPAAAHHNCAAGDVCPDEIGDAMEMHEEAIDGLSAMDPSDAAANPDDDDQVSGGTDPMSDDQSGALNTEGSGIGTSEPAQQLSAPGNWQQ